MTTIIAIAASRIRITPISTGTIFEVCFAGTGVSGVRVGAGAGAAIGSGRGD
jgi:hypothetical protein